MVKENIKIISNFCSTKKNIIGKLKAITSNERKILNNNMFDVNFSISWKFFSFEIITGPFML